MEETPPAALDPDDAAILALESSSIAGHTLKLVLLEPAAEPLDLEGLRAAVAARLGAEPRARERIELAEGEPRWAEDTDFAIEAHVVRHPEGRDGDEAELYRVAGELMGERLDHTRPLWRFDLVGPLADGREAIVIRIHHAMADGVSCVRFLDGVLWSAASPDAAATPPGAGHAAAPPPLHSRAQELRRLPGALRRELGGHGARSPMDRPIGGARELALVAAPLAELRRIGHSRPRRATVNDVLLAIVAGGLRRWFAAGERLPALRAQIPVSLHHRGEDAAELGNRDSFLNVDLPLAEADPLARLDRISAETGERKRLGDAQELYDFFHALARLHHLGPALERLAQGPREFSLSISNVPGPATAISVAGRRVERLGTVAEPAMRHALRISAISCAGTVVISMCTDPEALPGIAELAAEAEAALAELSAAIE